LEDGGVTVVKLGQVLSTHPDLLPIEFVDELTKPQDTVPPAPREQVREVLTAELGAAPAAVFAEFDAEPIAAASIARVHRARLHSDAEVVVKVQRPGARRMTEDDLDIVARPANTLQARTRWGRSIGVKNLAEGFAMALREELDLRVEARNIAAVSAARSDGPVRSAMRCSPSVARTGRNSHVLRQVILDGVFPADPQPGNIMLLDDGRLGMLDVGSVGRIDAQLRSALQKLLLPVDRADPAAMCDALLELVSKPEDIDEQQWERALGQFTARHLGAGMRPDVEMSGSLFRLVHRCGWAFRRRSPRCSARSPRWRAHSARSLRGSTSCLNCGRSSALRPART
jgi:ubiquinone biosynthesis protein